MNNLFLVLFVPDRFKIFAGAVFTSAAKAPELKIQQTVALLHLDGCCAAPADSADTRGQSDGNLLQQVQTGQSAEISSPDVYGNTQLDAGVTDTINRTGHDATTDNDAVEDNMDCSLSALRCSGLFGRPVWPHF